MKIKKINCIVLVIFATLLLSVFWVIVGSTQTKTTNTDLSFKVKTNKETFILGEPITAEFEISNKGENSFQIHAEGVETGFLKVFIASQDSEYKQYFGYGWGLIMGRMFHLAPGASHRYKEATILWNGKVDVSGLNERAAKEKLKGKITTEYALPKPGIYFVKGVSYVGENATLIESEPTQITINEPIGEDLKVWNQIKGNSEIALLMQAGEFSKSKDEEKEKIVREVEQLIVQYPNSIYSSYLKPNLEKYKANEERRIEFMKKSKQF